MTDKTGGIMKLYENRTRFKRCVDRLQRAATMFFAMFEDPNKTHISVYDLSEMKWKRIALSEYFFIYSETEREIRTIGDVRLLITALWHVAKGRFNGNIIGAARKVFDTSDYEDESTMLLRQLFGVVRTADLNRRIDDMKNEIEKLKEDK